MAHYDLTTSMAPYFDPHLVFPLLEYLQDQRVYPVDQIIRARINLVAKTNMVEYAIDIHQDGDDTEDLPSEIWARHPSFCVEASFCPWICSVDMVKKVSKVERRMESLEELAAPLISFLQNPRLVHELRQDKQYNLQMLQRRYKIGSEQMEALYQYAKLQFDRCFYYVASNFLSQYRMLCTNRGRSFSALWRKLDAEILMQRWDLAIKDFNCLKEIIDSKKLPSRLDQLQQRTRLMHRSLFIFFNHKNGHNGIIDLFFNNRYLNAIKTNAHHLFRYLAAAVIVNKERPTMMKKLIKVIQQEHYTYKDPITEFLKCLYVNYDFESAQEKLRDCEQLILIDFFLAKQFYCFGLVTIPLRGEFLENARLLILETYCKMHQRIDIGTLSQKLNMNYDDAERRIVNLIRTARLDAKIDSKERTVVMTTQHPNAHEQIMLGNNVAASGTTVPSSTTHSCEP